MPYETSLNGNPIWVPRDSIIKMHDDQINKYGGCPGGVNEALLDSALAKPQQNWFYGKSLTIFQLAAEYTSGLTCNHAFSDGNKRTGFVVTYVFLKLNGYSLNVPTPDEVEQTMVEIASGNLTQEDIANWLKTNSQPIF